MKGHPSLVLLVAVLLAGCSDPASSTASADRATSFASASLPAGPSGTDPQLAPGPFLTDPNTGGAAASFDLVEVSFGRAVEVWAHDSHGFPVRVAADFVIGPDYRGDGVQVRVDEHPVRGVDRLIIEVDVDDRRAGGGRDQFLAAIDVAANTAIVLRDAGVNGAGMLSHVPRNAALSLQFSDLIDTSDLAVTAPGLLVGAPAIVPFDVRVVPDTLHGGLAATAGRFHTTRLIVDLAVRECEQRRAQRPLGLSPSGLPAARGDGPSAVLRLPTAAASLLANLSGQPLGVGAGSVDYGTPTHDIVRFFGTGSGGFLDGTAPPVLVMRTDMDIVIAPSGSFFDPYYYTLPRIQFRSPGCAAPAQIGDVIRQPNLLAEVIADSGPVTGNGLDNVRVILLEYPPAWSGPTEWRLHGVGPALYDAPYDLSMDARRIACLVSVDPDPLGAPGAPTRGIDPASTFTLRFNEPIDAASLEGLDAALLGREAIASDGVVDAADIIVAELVAPADGESLQLVPLLPLAHAQGNSEVIWLTPRIGVGAVRDLAGNALVDSPGPIAMSLDPAAAPEQTGSFMFRFADIDEAATGGWSWDGQLFWDFTEQVVRARPVVRFSANIDQSQPIVQLMTALPFGLQTPLNGLGARMQTIWRYADMGFGLTDPSTLNVDVEGLSWAPSGGQVTADSFAEFEIRLSHARFAPDEYIDPASLFPAFQNSGLRPTFDVNTIPGVAQETVHDRMLGYNIDPANAYQSQTGQTLIHYPLNQGVPAGQRDTYTWRDTEIRGRAGPTTSGVEPRAYLLALGIPLPSVPFYRPNHVQTAGLPLLMDFLTWPDASANGLNGLVSSLAVNSSSKPYFRAFSAGGIDQSGSVHVVDPSLETAANGGFNPNSAPPGAQTYGRDNALNHGAVDFVVRKSVAHSIWLELGPDSPQRTVVEPLVAPQSQPPGASVTVLVRGGSRIFYQNSGMSNTDNDSNNDGRVDYLTDARKIELYGDYYNDVEYELNHDPLRQNPGLSFTGAFDDWHEDVAALDGARFVQLRIRFESDLATGATPTVSAIGVAWRN